MIEGSKDKNTWDVIDKQDDSPYLKGTGLVHTYEIKGCQPAKEYIRLRQTGKSANKNSTDNDHLIINSIEFYGTLIESNS